MTIIKHLNFKKMTKKKVKYAILTSTVVAVIAVNISLAQSEERDSNQKKERSSSKTDHCYCNYLAHQCVADPPHSTAFCGIWAPDCSPYNYECGSGGGE